MEKNELLLLSDFIYQLQTAENLSMVKTICLQRLKLLIPFSYGSIFMVEKTDGTLHLADPCCFPASFEKTEREYMKLESIDHTDWFIHASESMVIRESDLLKDHQRLNSPIYQKFYNHYNIYDTLQMSIAWGNKILAVLTLYRTKDDGLFKNDDVFWLQTLKKHIQYAFYVHTLKKKDEKKTDSLPQLISLYHLTRKEAEVVELIFEDYANPEIARRLQITEHTLQKHLQNIYRKLQISARWELLKFR